MPTKQPDEFLKHRVELNRIRQELWDSVDPPRMTLELFLAIAKVAGKVVSGEVRVETVKSNLSELNPEPK